MIKFINKIDLTLEHTNKQVVIDLQGKNLIVTGANGCGKTKFLNQVFRWLDVNSDSRAFFGGEEFKHIARNIKSQLNSVVNSPVTTEQQKDYSERVISENIEKLNKIMPIEMKAKTQVLRKLFDNQLSLRFFPATRQYKANQIDHNATIQKMRDQAKHMGLNFDTSINFESYLVTYLNAGYMAFALRQDESEKQKVDAWLANITKDLRYLFEDDSLELEYREKEKRFYIKQEGKDPFTFEQLSSGYSAILAIYTDLLMKVELREITPQELEGIVIIDEIDAHLHVSLQKKILAFFDQAYPNIQFIVSTHSSLVIQSVDNAVIYDLSKLEQLENLSMYSADAITKGLLGANTNSNSLVDIVSELANLTPNIEGNEQRVKELIAKLKENEQGLDSKSKVALLMAEQALLDNKLAG